MTRIYYGWYIVAIAGLANMLVTGTTYSAFGLFVLPVSNEYGLSRANMNTGLILLNVGNALLAPVLGRLLDRLPPQRIMLVCGVFLGLGFVCLGLLRSVPLSAVVIATLVALGVQGSSLLTMTVLIARWFVAQRGRAMALSVIGISLGSIIVAPIIGLLIEKYGWRTALLIMGISVAVLIVLMTLAVRGWPGSEDVEQRSAPVSRPRINATPIKMGTVLRMGQFWSIALSAALAGGVAQTLIITLVPLARQEGLTMVQATSLISIMGGASMAAKLLLAVVADKVDRIVLLSGVFVLGAIINGALLVSDEYVLLVACAAVLGVTTSSVAPVVYALVADRFGPASFGTVRGLTAPISGVIGAVAVRLGGEIFDRTGSYDLMFASFIAAQLVAALLMFATRFTKPLAAPTDDPAPAST